VIDLSGSTVHLWRFGLDVDDTIAAALEASLELAEMARSRRFRSSRERRRFVVSHGFLRQILGAYLDRPPNTLRFTQGPHGKPTLDTPGAPERLEFSISRSADLALYAVARGRRVGVDVERVRPDFDWRLISARYQTEAERERLAMLPPQAQLVAFFEWWTRSEAYVKACGEGLGAGEARLGAEPDPRWSIVALDAGPGFTAALAVDGPDIQIVPIVECEGSLAA
jgi:4'-phosphopantetheinyl transferase